MTAVSDSAPLELLSHALSDLIGRLAPAVVSLHAHRTRSSGLVWKPGLIVTADEALAEEGAVAARLAGGSSSEATVAGRDPGTDIALLRAATGSAPPVSLERSPPKPGALVVVLGAADGEPIAALGMVARVGAPWRSLRGGDIDARIELDIRLRPEAEGGVALDVEGRALGMVVSGPRRRVHVIPALTLERVATQLETHGRVARGFLGLGLHPVRIDRNGGHGLMVITVDSDGPAARAGIHQGDVIESWNGEVVSSLPGLLRRLGPASVGQSVQLSLRRGGASQSAKVIVGERPCG